jgi:PTH1 family peptidyl-tRNA hydrolase
MMVLLGLGNPGRAYTKGRHNAGFWCIDALAERHGIRLRDRRRHAVIAEGEIAATPVVLAKSRTYMNSSGTAARYLLDRFHATPQELMVVHDDMDLPLGTIRLRPGGGAAGHHGIESVIAELRTEQFSRLRIGVEHPTDREDGIAHVLGPFNAQEATVMRETIEQAVEAVTCAVELGLDTAMNRFN